MKPIRSKYDSVVLADEATLLAAIDHGSHEWHEGWFPVPLASESLGRLSSKAQFLSDARQKGIATPRFAIRASATDLRDASRSTGFPLFIKSARGSLADWRQLEFPLNDN